MNNYTDEDLKNIVESLTPEQLNTLYKFICKKNAVNCKGHNSYINRLINKIINDDELLKKLVSSNNILAHKFDINKISNSKSGNVKDEVSHFKSYVKNNFNIYSDDTILQMFMFIVFTYYTLVEILGKNFIFEDNEIIDDVAKYSQKVDKGIVYIVSEKFYDNWSEELDKNGIILKIIVFRDKAAPTIKTLSIFKNKTDNKVKAYLINDDVTEFNDLSTNFQKFYKKIQKDELSNYIKYKKYKDLLKSIENSLSNNTTKYRKRSKSLIVKNNNSDTGKSEDKEEYKTCILCNKPEINPINQKTQLCFHCYIFYLYLCENNIITKREFVRLLKNNDFSVISNFVHNYKTINKNARFKIPEEKLKKLVDVIDHNIQEFSNPLRYIKSSKSNPTL